MLRKVRLGTGSSTQDTHERRRPAPARRIRSGIAGATTLLLGLGVTPALTTTPAIAAAPVGQGFHLNASDLRFILRQIEIGQRHAATATADEPCQTLVGDGPNQIPGVGNGRELPWGLRTVDGSCNNLVPIAGRDRWGAADTVFPRLVDPALLRAAQDNTSYGQNTGFVFDRQPRRVSNLVVDQTAGNPAAVAAAGTAVPAPGDGATLFIENVAPDVGLSAPFNSWFTLFGQFFDHGLDLVSKGGNGTVFMPLDADDPLFSNAAGAPNFMVLSRATHAPGAAHEAVNTTTSYVDQNQTYTSHPSHQVFLREYDQGPDGPVPTGRLLTGPGGGMADWDTVQAQARSVLGIELSDADVLNVPLLATDAYGHFEPGPNGLPLMVKPNAAGGLVEGNLTTPVTSTGATKTGHAFLDDIAHHAAPGTFDPDGPQGPEAPQPLAPDSDPGTGDDHNPRTYDDEMLGRHFIAGDGRTNENIGLTSVHHVFHSEHNRLQADIDRMINDPATGLTAAEVARWTNVDQASGWGYGERLFQAARFVTEMEYQHLVFEEFARKVQPMVNPFGEGGTGYNTDVNASIHAEFAHAVYRFGHSMLTETVARRGADGANQDLPLLDAFLNPPEFLDGYVDADGNPDPDAAAGAVVRGMTRQTGNEIDEFVTEALRNNLLGLPLDLATINMARARDTGIPTLNEARRAFYAESDNSALTPYQSWADFRFSLKHPESLANFIAAYGTHPSLAEGGADGIVADVAGTAEDEAADNVDTIAERRNAAELLVYGPAGADGVEGDLIETEQDEAADDPTGTQPADAFDFINGIGAYRNQGGRTVTGVDDIDLWVGGLAEKQMVFGGLLGPTFNFVFEKQMEDLQDGDRFYYLSRTAGLNLLTQLEGNSFAELTMRNTDVEALPADAFSRPDFVFNIGAGNTVLDNPETVGTNESSLVTPMATDGTLRFGGAEHVVFNGTAGNDRVWSSEGDDTVRGNAGDDWVQGGDGNDNLIGGEGDDTLLDLSGDETIKGGDGDDTISSGQGFGGDLNQGGRGNDLVVGGNDAAETFGGAGNDLVYAGDGDDTVFGDDGDDWIEAGRGAFNLLQGDNGAPFQDDLNAPGHDVLDGDGGEQDYDAEGGDDIMRAGPGIQRSEGMRGFDWVTHQGDPLPADSDMDFTGLLPPSVDTNRDRFDLVEGLSGYGFDDVLRGDDRTVDDLTAGPGEAADSHLLTQEGIDRIDGLDTVLPAGATSFAGGNILIGGAGSDEIEGRGGDDVIDGDAQLTVELRVPYKNPNTPTKVVASLSTVRADVLAGLIDPGDITIVRRIERPADGSAVDTAVFSNPQDEYTITDNDDGTTTVAHDGGLGIDGTDTLRGIEELVFGAGTPPVDLPAAPAVPTITQVTAGANSARVFFTPGDDGGSALVGLTLRVFEGTATSPSRTVPLAPTVTNVLVSDLAAGVPVRFALVARNAVGSSPASAQTNPVTPTAPPTVPPPVVPPTTPPVVPPTTPPVVPPTTPDTPGAPATPATGPGGAGGPSQDTGAQRQAPGAPVIKSARSGQRGGKAQAVARWRAPSSDGGATITGYRVLAQRIGDDGRVTRTIVSHLVPRDARHFTMRLPEGTYRFRVVAVNEVGQGARSQASNAVTSR